MVNLTDLELIELTKQGNELAFEHLLHRYRPLIKKLVRNYYAHSYEAEDFYQIAALSFYQAILDFNIDERMTFYSFVLSCVRNKLISVLREIYEDMEYVSDSEDILVYMYARPEYDRNSEIMATMNNDSLYDYRVRVANLLKSQNFFSRTEYRCFKCFVDGLSYNEIAEVQGMKLKQVDGALSRVRDKMRMAGLRNS